MPVDPSQLSADVDFLTSQPGWQDAPKRGDYIRGVAVKSLQDDTLDPEHHAAVMGELWKRNDDRGILKTGADFVATGTKEVLKSFPAFGGAAVLAATDAFGVTDSGSGTRLKRGVAGLADAAVQRAKSLHPNDRQEQRDASLDALKQDLDARAYPDGLEAWLAGHYDGGEDKPDEETELWINSLTWGLARKAVAADHMGGVNKDRVRTWIESDRNPARKLSDTGDPGPKALLGDYLVTRDPASWEAFKARVSETDTQHTTRLRRYASEGELRQVQQASTGGLADDLTTRAAEFQTSPIDMVATVLPFLRGAKAFSAAKAGTKGKALVEAGKGVAMEAGSEGLTEALQDPNASNTEIATAAGMGAVGAGTLTGTATAAGMVANKLATPVTNELTKDTNSVTPAPPAAPLPAGQEGATDADFNAAETGVLAQIAANAGRTAPTSAAAVSPPAIAPEATPAQPSATTPTPVPASTAVLPVASAAPTASAETPQAPAPSFTTQEMKLAALEPKAPASSALTPDAEALLAAMDEAGSVPGFMTGELALIAIQNGVNVTRDTTPAQIVEALRERRGTGKGFTNTAVPPRTEAGFVQLPDEFKGAWDHGVELVRQGITDFAKWSVEMVKKFGEAIRDYLKDVWAAATKTSEMGAVQLGGTVEKQASEPDLGAARSAATMPNAPDSASQARPLKDQFGGAPQDYTAFTDEDMAQRANAVVDSVGSLDQLAGLLGSVDGVRSLGLDAAQQEYVQAEALRRAAAAVDSAANDVDRIRATQTMRRLKALHDVSGTAFGQQGAARKLAGEDMRAAMSVDTAIEKQQKATIDRAIPVEALKQTVEAASMEASAQTSDSLASKLEAEAKGEAPAAPAEQREKIAVLQAQVDAYFDGNTPKRVKVIYDPAGESEAQLRNGILELNAAAVSDPSTEDVARMLEHEIGHGLFSDPAMREHFNTLWNSLDRLDRAAIENEVAERYSAAERNEESSVRALDTIRARTRGDKSQGAWNRFVSTVSRLWQKFTGAMPKDPAALAARMIEVGVQRLKTAKAGKGLAMSKRTDLLKTDSPTLAKLLNSLRAKIRPEIKWRELFKNLPAQQRQWELKLYASIRQHQALQGLSPTEARELAREMSKAWQRERRKVFNRELEKQLVKVSGVKPKAAAKVKASAPRLLQLINLGAFDSDTFRDAVAQEWGIKSMASSEAKRLKDIATRMQQTPEGVPQRKLAQQFVEGLQDLTKLSKLEILENWWTASVLSGWRTMTDIALGVANGIEDVGLGAMVTAVRTGNIDVAGRGIGRVIANLPRALAEAFHHVLTGDKSMMRNFDAEWREALTDGNRMMNNAARQLRGSPVTWLPGVFMEAVARMLTALDHVNSSSTFEGAKMMAMARHPELYKAALAIGPREKANARAQARSELTGGAEPTTHTERLQENARVKEILDAGAPTEIMAQATEISRDSALQGEPTGLGWAIWWSAQNIGKLPGLGAEAIEKSGVNNPAGKLVLAALRRASTVAKVVTGTKFVRTAGHAMNRNLSYVPGLGLGRFAEGSMRGAKADILLAKQLVGTAVGLAAYLGFKGGDDDDEHGLEGSWKGLTPQQRSQLYTQGKQPNTAWHRDSQGRVRSYNYLQWGVAGILGTVGAMNDQRKYHANKDELSVLINGITSGSMTWSEKAQLQGLQQVFGDSPYSSGSVADTLAQKLNRYAATNVGGLIPRVAKDVDALIAPELHSSQEWWAKWAQQVPMLRETATGKRMDIFGADIKLDRGPLSRVTLVGTSDPAYRILGQMNAKDLWLSDPTTGVRKVKLAGGIRRDMTPQEKDKYQRRAGEGYKAFILEHGENILAMDQDRAKKYIKDFTKIIRDRAAYQATQ